jgi:NADH-quinone oxidoreductase subunit C/D
MVFKDAALTPAEMPKTTPVPEQHGRPHPTGFVPDEKPELLPPTQPVSLARQPAATRRGVAIERFPLDEEGMQDPLAEDLVVLNVGPSHPAMHGAFRIKCWLDGETIVKAVPEIGYLHRCFEKMSELHPWQEVIPYTDRLNYMSSFLNNVGYCMAVEKMLGIEIPKRAQRIRVILGELSRIMDHLVCIGTNLVDLGALTNFWYAFRGREEIYSLLEHVSGARMMVAYGRIGGLMRDVHKGFEDEVRTLLRSLPSYIDDVDRLITNNRIFIDRTRGIHTINAAEAIDWGWTGPCLRACGVPYDIRKVHPYYDYDQLDWQVPVGTTGDVYDRYLVRMEEMRQSLRIVEQALDDLPDGPVNLDDWSIVPPPKDAVYNTIEGMVAHFKLVFEGIQVPPGEVYSYSEGGNGELGFYIVSEGGGQPYRIHCRGPCFAIYQNIGVTLEGHMLSDIVAIIGSLNIVAGELDR